MFFTYTQSRFASGVFDGVLGPLHELRFRAFEERFDSLKKTFSRVREQDDKDGVAGRNVR